MAQIISAPQLQQQFQTQQDPLFEALVKYITTGSGAVPASASAIQDIIDGATGPGSRAYLESLAHEHTETDKTIWQNEAETHGFLRLEPIRATVELRARQGNMSLKVWNITAVFDKWAFFPGFAQLDGRILYNGDIGELSPVNVHAYVDPRTGKFYMNAESEVGAGGPKPLWEFETLHPIGPSFPAKGVNLRGKATISTVN